MARMKRRRLGIVAYYGPDNTRATKLVASVMRHEHDEHPVAMQRWTVEDGDIREDIAVAAELMAFLSGHRVKEVGTAPHIMGCPHEEGIDYPLGRTCPQCPFWATFDREANRPLEEPVPELSVEQVLADLSRPDPRDLPFDALESADVHRAALTEPLLRALERCLDSPFPAAASDAEGIEHPPAADEPQTDAVDVGPGPGTARPEVDDAQLMHAKYGLYLLAKWREPRACPLVLRWLSLPGDTARDMFDDDLVTEDAGRILASVSDGDLEPIQALVLNREANPWCRAAGVRALALLGAWAEVPGERIVDWFVWLAGEGLEREPSAVWHELAASSLDIEAVPVFDALRRALAEGLIDPEYVDPEEFDEVEEAEPGERLEHTQDHFGPFDDVAEEIAWWACFTGLDEPDIDALELETDDEDEAGEWDEEDEEDGRDGHLNPESSWASSPAGMPGSIPQGAARRTPQKVGRNDPCPCGSGKKHKKCCGA